MTTTYHLAEINIAKIKGVTIDAPIMQEFVDNLDQINELAEKSEGFVWRLKDDSNNATQLNPYNDVQIIINVSVWKDVKTLFDFTFKTFHTDFLKRRREWFQRMGEAHLAMWWIPENHEPTMTEAVEKLNYLQKNGSSELAFGFKQTYPPPNSILYSTANVEDCEHIAALHAHSWQKHYQRILSEDYLNNKVETERLSVWKKRFENPAPNQQIFTAKNGAVLCGFTCIYGGKHPQYGSYLDNLHVAKSNHGKGIGRKLMQLAGDWVAKNYADAGMYLYVFTENKQAIAFYEKVGGVCIEKGMYPLDDGSGKEAEILLYHWEAPYQFSE